MKIHLNISPQKLEWKKHNTNMNIKKQHSVLLLKLFLGAGFDSSPRLLCEYHHWAECRCTSQEKMWTRQRDRQSDITTAKTVSLAVFRPSWQGRRSQPVTAMMFDSLTCFLLNGRRYFLLISITVYWLLCLVFYSSLFS